MGFEFRDSWLLPRYLVDSIADRFFTWQLATSFLALANAMRSPQLIAQLGFRHLSLVRKVPNGVPG